MFEPILIDARNPGPMTGAGNNTYLIVDRGEALLIDAGIGHAGHLDALAGHLTRRGARLQSVIVTHAHPDHISGVPALAMAYPQVTFWKYSWPGDDQRDAVDWRPLVDNQAVRVGSEGLVALHTPGHAPDHLALWHESSRSVFVGDLVVAGSSVAIQGGRGGSLSAYLASLERLIERQPHRLFPAHGAVVDDPHPILRKSIDHRLLRERQVIAALAAGHRTVTAIAESIYDGLAPALMPAARDTVRAHLEKLREEGRATVEAERWRL